MTVPARILAVDPGTSQSGWVLYAHRTNHPILSHGITDNELLVAALARGFLPLADTPHEPDLLLLEWMAGSYGQIGPDTLRTVWWTGRFTEAWQAWFPNYTKRPIAEMTRPHVKRTLGAKNDSDVRAAVLDALGPKGTKAEPGPCFGIAGHEWQACGLALAYALDLESRPIRDRLGAEERGSDRRGADWTGVDGRDREWTG